MQTFSQSNFKRFFKVLCPLKTWIIRHSFKAKKALIISGQPDRVVAFVARTNLLEKNLTGEQVDAFRDAFCMATLHHKIGKNSAHYLGKAHEKHNYKTYKKRRFFIL
jgi:hypothetical protein